MLAMWTESGHAASVGRPSPSNSSQSMPRAKTAINAFARNAKTPICVSTWLPTLTSVASGKNVSGAGEVTQRTERTKTLSNTRASAMIQSGAHTRHASTSSRRSTASPLMSTNNSRQHKPINVRFVEAHRRLGNIATSTLTTITRQTRYVDCFAPAAIRHSVCSKTTRPTSKQQSGISPARKSNGRRQTSQKGG